MRILRSFFQKILFILFYGHLGMLQFFLIHEKYKMKTPPQRFLQKETLGQMLDQVVQTPTSTVGKFYSQLQLRLPIPPY